MPDVLIQGRDGFFSGYRVPARSGKGPGIVLLQEIFGVNKVMRTIADWLAGEGYTVICPDLFWRQEPNIQLNAFTQAEWDKAFALYGGFSEAKGVDDITDTIKFLRADPACSGRVGTVGYCLGGKLAYLAATRTDADCSVGYYGVGIEKALDEAGKIKKPLMLHIAKADKFVPPPAQEQIRAALGANSKVTLYDYEGCDHAFARPEGDHYNKEAADLANSRTLGFFKRHLAAPAPAAPVKPPAPAPAKPAAAAMSPAPAKPPAPPKPPAPAKTAAPAMSPAPAKPAAPPKPPAPRPTLTLAKPPAAKPVAKAAAKPAAKKPTAKKPAPKKAKPAKKAQKAAKKKAPRKPAKKAAAKRKNSKKRGRR